MYLSNLRHTDLSQPQDGSEDERLIRGLLFSQAFDTVRKSFLPYEISACEADGGRRRLIVKMSSDRLAEFVYSLGVLLTKDHALAFYDYVLSAIQKNSQWALGEVVAYKNEYLHLTTIGQLEVGDYLHVCEGPGGMQKCVGKITISKRFQASKEYAGSIHRLLTKAEYDEWVTSLLKHV